MSLYRIDKLFNFEKGTLQSSKCEPGSYTFITASAEWKTHNNFSYDCEALVFAAAASGSLGRTHYVNGKFIASDLCFVLTSKDPAKFPIDLRFYHIIFNELRSDIVKNTKAGTSKEAISLGNFARYGLPYFEIEKQIEIKKQFVHSEKIKETLTAELSRQLDFVKQLRQSFLREAMQGKLVPQDPKDGPASELLQKIKAALRQAQDDKKGKKQKELPPIKEDEIPFVIPDNWVWCRLGEIITFGPSNGFSPKGSGNEKGIKCLTLTATTSGFFKEDYFKFVDELVEADSYLWLRPGDILLQRGNSLDYVGIAALYNGKANEFIYPDLMIKIRASQDVSSHFLHWVLISPFNRIYFQTMASGAQKSMPKITQEVVINTLIPLPPLPEQHRIVAKLEQLLQHCDDLEQSIRQSKEQTNMLLQAALKEALKGKEG